MDPTRREFLRYAGLLPLAGCSRIETRPARPRESVTSDRLPQLSAAELATARELFKWLQAAGWLALLGLDFAPADRIDPNLLKIIPPPSNAFHGCAGERAIEPGAPQLSLLYHALASPDVTLGRPGARPASHYPEPRHLDALEDLIYRLDPTPSVLTDETALAVLAYEYRPASRTPHKVHADLVFSRTGVGRVGDAPAHYDREGRSYTTRPAAPDEARKIAVLPARFGLFLVERLPLIAALEARSVMGERQTVDEGHYVLRPLRKICDGDPLLGDRRIRFAEYHRTDKLKRLFTYFQERGLAPRAAGYDLNRPPFLHDSETGPLVELEHCGSSVIVKSVPRALVRPAELPEPKGSVAQFTVPGARGSKNRRYRTLKLWTQRGSDSWGAIMETVYRRRRLINLHAARNVAMFVNIRHRVDDREAGRLYHIDDPRRTDDGNYEAVAFADSICDGCVTLDDRIVSGGSPVLPAFSIVSAPDFLPLVDVSELYGYSNHFLEGDITPLSDVRRPANPHVRLPGSPTSAFPTRRSGFDTASGDTVAAVVSQLAAAPADPDVRPRAAATPFRSSLPDAASGVFYPGWDATFSGTPGASYIATFALGSPFAEDLKLCAAANGMWPVAAPDAARTFQGSLTYPLRRRGSPTAVPLLDKELGLHPDSAAVREHGMGVLPGWDGEFGPFLAFDRDGRLVVNYANIESVDYVHNLCKSRFDPTLLRDRTAAELISRMDALAVSLCALDGAHRRVRHSRYWLVSAERVGDWNHAGPHGWGTPRALPLPPDFDPTRHARGASGPGFLYTFASTSGVSRCAEAPMRLTQVCREIAICQIAASHANTPEVAVVRWGPRTGWRPG